MKKIVFLISLISFLLIAPSSFADVPRSDSRRYTCLSAMHCTKGTKPDNRYCEPNYEDPNADKVHTSTQWGHRSQISLDALGQLPPNSQVLVTECIDAGVDLNDPKDGKNDPVCTTGDSSQDKLLFCGDANATNPVCDHFTLLKNNRAYSLEWTSSSGVYYLINGVFQKSTGQIISVGADGKPTVKTIEWESHTPANLNRSFIGWYFNKSNVTPTSTSTQPGVSPAISPAIGGQQQAILSFPTYIPEPSSPPPDVEPCHGEPYDPYGRVFDMKTLEPIPMSNVLLKQKNPQGVFDSEYAKQQNLLIINPFPTDGNGEYLFFVNDSDYALAPTKQGYVHPASNVLSTLLPNTLSVYSDLYFSNSDPILQRGEIQHRDIPLMPSSGVGQTYPLKVLSEVGELSVNGRMTYSGRVSHPYAEIDIETCKKVNGTEVCNNPQVFGPTTGGVNKYGNFSITLDQTKLEPGEYYNRSFKKVDLTTIHLARSFDFKNVYSWLLSFVLPQEVSAEEQVDRASLQPIVSYIEGYAYDKSGSLMANAKVNLKIPLSEEPVYQTTTNDRGYYKITSEFLPKMEYAVEYAPSDAPNNPTKITTSQLLAQNKEFIAAEKVNPYLITTAANDPRKNTVPTFVPSSKIAETTGSSAPIITSAVQQPESSSGINNNIYLIGGILLILIATAGTLIGVHLYKKRSQENPGI